MRGIVIGMSLAVLAGCGGADKGAGSSGNAAQNGSASKAAAPALDETQRRVAAMGENERNAVLIQAIRGARQDCQHVDSSQAVDNAAGQPSYVATCDRAKRYVVTVGPNGVGAVTTMQEPGR